MAAQIKSSPSTQESDSRSAIKNDVKPPDLIKKETIVKQEPQEIIKECDTSDNEQYKCKLCPLIFGSMQTVLAHELTHIETVGTINAADKKTVLIRKKRKRAKNLSIGDDKPEDRELYELAKQSLTIDCPEGSELKRLCRLYQPDPYNLLFVYERVSFDLAYVLRKEGQWDIHPFGSTVTGMAFKTSDIDFYIEPKSGIEDYTVLFKKVRRLLCSSDKFEKIISIPKARVPIIKCTHKMTGYSMDINMSTRHGVYNSAFIAKCLLYDTRIHPLMLIIKIWAKNFGIARTGRMTNFCLCLLVFFYLQKLSEPILTSFCQLTQNCPKVEIDGINFAFNSKQKNKTKNRSNIFELINGFFAFYKNFDFRTKIISTYLGQDINRESFENGVFYFPQYNYQLNLLQSLAEENESQSESLNARRLRTNTPIVVQDPFSLNLSKSSMITENIFNHFKKCLDVADSICQAMIDKNYTSGQFLITLLYPDAEMRMSKVPAILQPVIQNETNPNKREPSTEKTITTRQTASTAIAKNPLPTNKNHEKSVNKLTCKFGPLETELFFIRNHLRKAYPGLTFDKTEVNKCWNEKLVEFLSEILQKIFLLRLTSINKNQKENGTLCKTVKTVGQIDVHYNKYSIYCEIYGATDVWTARKEFPKKVSWNFIQEQIDLTNELKKQRSKSHRTSLNCRLMVTPNTDFTDLTLTLEDLSDPMNGNNNSKTNTKNFFNEFTRRMRYLFRAYFENFARETAAASTDV